MSDINSGLLNDVLIVGNELSGKLNEIGVSNTFGKASEGKDDLISLIRMAIDGIDMVVDEKSYVSLTATNPYLLTGETTDIVAKFRNGVCKPLNNKNVIIGQSVFIDDGTTASHNDHWYINNYGTATVQSDGTKLLNISGTINFVMRSIVPSNKTITEPNTYSYNPPFVIEFDIVETDAITSNNDAQVQIYSLRTNDNFAQGITTGHYKIEVTSEEQKIWLDDTLIKTRNLSLPNARITFRVRNGKYLIYKNLKVYEITNRVTDENGEFALHDVSVTDDTAFTATYGTVSDTCIVYDISDSLFGKLYYLMNDLTTIRANNPFSKSTLSLSSDWKITDEQSLKIVVGSSGQYFGIRTGANYFNITDDIKGKTVRFSAYVNSPKPSNLVIYRYVNNSWVYTNSQIVVPSGEQYAELTFTLESDATEFWFKLETYQSGWNEGDIIYTDCWNLEVLD